MTDEPSAEDLDHYSDYDMAVTVIGRLSLAYSTLEGRMHGLAWDIVEYYGAGGGMGALLTEGMGAAEVNSLVRRLAVLTPVKVPIEEVVERFTTVSVTRNTALHALPRGSIRTLDNLKHRLKEASGGRYRPGVTLQQADAATFECHDIGELMTTISQALKERKTAGAADRDR